MEHVHRDHRLVVTIPQVQVYCVGVVDGGLCLWYCQSWRLAVFVALPHKNLCLVDLAHDGELGLVHPYVSRKQSVQVYVLALLETAGVLLLHQALEFHRRV